MPTDRRGPDATVQAIARIALVCALGLASTISLAFASAAWLPLDRAGGLVARDGDHLQPWQLRLERPTACRLIWFEKGRIYGKQGVGPANGSSAAVSCWSFATSTRQNPTMIKTDFALSPEMNRLIAQGPPQPIWGIAEDRRGWPWPAVRCWFIGTMDSASASPWVVQSGGALPIALTVRDSLVTLRALPYDPMWPGLAGDALVFSAVWLVILAAAGRLRTWIRVRFRTPAGCCPACGYDLRGVTDTGCPECGWNRAPAQSPRATPISGP